MKPPSGRNANDSLQDAASRALLDQLDKAHQRLAEVEKDAQRWRLEREDLARNVARLNHSFSEALTPPPPFWRSDAARIASTMAKLSLSQRREIWLQTLGRLKASDSMFGFYPHDGGADPITILVVGSGGFGDILFLTPILRELRRTFRACRTFVTHQHAGVTSLLGDCPYVVGVESMTAAVMSEILSIACVLDIFDLIVDVRYSVTYTAPPMSRIPFEFLRAAHVRASEWQRFTLSDWPHMNNYFAKEATRRKMGQFDLAGYTGNLDVHQNSPLSLTPSAPPPDAVYGLAGKPYITIHNGADPAMVGASGLQTKNLPIEHWQRIVAGLEKAGYLTAQLGEKNEAAVPGVHVDLRGVLTFAEAASVIKTASAHIDTEGGLVHAARAVFTRSVVAFGPTSMPFFAYPTNVNFPPPLCGDCWWIARDWAARCVRGLERPECMDSQKTHKLIAAAIELAHVSRLLTTIPGSKAYAQSIDAPAAEVNGFAEAPAGFIHAPKAPAAAGVSLSERAKAMADAAGPGARGLVYLETTDAVREWFDLRGDLVGCDIAVPAAIWRDVDDEFGDELLAHPIAGEHLAIETDSLDWFAAEWSQTADGAFVRFMLEAGRCVKPGGPIWLRVFSGDDDSALSAMAQRMKLFAAQLLGVRYRLDVAALVAQLPDAPRSGDRVELEMTSVLQTTRANEPINVPPAMFAAAGAASSIGRAAAPRAKARGFLELGD
jgi:ADP-heptose:LPS heptosyltransferase